MVPPSGLFHSDFQYKICIFYNIFRNNMRTACPTPSVILDLIILVVSLRYAVSLSNFLYSSLSLCQLDANCSKNGATNILNICLFSRREPKSGTFVRPCKIVVSRELYDSKLRDRILWMILSFSWKHFTRNLSVQFRFVNVVLNYFNFTTLSNVFISLSACNYFYILPIRSFPFYENPYFLVVFMSLRSK